jgi:hypothetical protein
LINWIVKWIFASSANSDCPPVEKGISLTRFFQRLFDFAPVVAGVLIHLPALTAILLPTVAGF